MNALLLAAGLGKRLRPITDSTPKCLVEINGKPLLEIWLNKLDKCKEIEKIFINTHYFPEKVESFVKSLKPNLKKKIKLLFEEKLLGTAGTLKQLKSQIKGNSVLLAHADNLSIFSLKDFIKAYKDRPVECLLTMMTFKTETPNSCGILSTNFHNIVTSFKEKPPNPSGKLANGAIYIISPDGLNEITNLSGVTDFSVDVIPKFFFRINTWHNSIYHKDIGTPDSLKQAQTDWKNLTHERSNL